MTQRWCDRLLRLVLTLSLSLALALSLCPSARAQDCNGNGVPDATDVFEGASADCNGNLVPDECEVEPPQFTVRSAFAVSGEPRFSTAADVDGDGLLDFATGNVEAGSSSVSILLNRGDGTFVLDAIYPIAQAPYSLILADLTGDGLADLITANQVADSVSFLANEGGGHLGAPLHFKVGDGPRYVVAGDLDADGDLDVVSANHSSADVTVLYNRTQGARGAPFLERICTEAEFHRVSRQSTQTGVARLSKYMVPADPDDPGLLPALFQNVGRFETHLEFLREVFPERFPGLDVETYNRLVNLRATRKYFVGILFRLRTEAGPLYGFNVLGDFSRTEELPSLDEVRGVYESLREVFALTPLVCRSFRRSIRNSVSLLRSRESRLWKSRTRRSLPRRASVARPPTSPGCRASCTGNSSATGSRASPFPSATISSSCGRISFPPLSIPRAR